MHSLTFPLPLFCQYLRDQLQQPTRPLRCPVGISRYEGSVELIAAPTHSDTGRTLVLSLTDDFTPPPLPADGAGVLLIGRERQRGHAVGGVQLTPDHLAPLDILRLVGPGMFTVPLANSPLHPFTPSPLQARDGCRRSLDPARRNLPPLLWRTAR